MTSIFEGGTVPLGHLTRKSNERGDTLIEVLIVIAILALVLGGAFAASRRSFITTQKTQERTVATKLLEQQIELLTIAADDTDEEIFGGAAAGNFCMANDASVVTAGGPACNRNNLYDITISRTNAIVNAEQHFTYHVTITWDSLSGNEDSVEAHYRVHPKV